RRVRSGRPAGADRRRAPRAAARPLCGVAAATDRRAPVRRRGRRDPRSLEARPGQRWRQDVSVHHRGLSALERGALDAAAAGTTFGAVCERLAGGRDDEAAATQAFTWLSSWVLDGLLTA